MKWATLIFLLVLNLQGSNNKLLLEDTVNELVEHITKLQDDLNTLTSKIEYLEQNLSKINSSNDNKNSKKEDLNDLPIVSQKLLVITWFANGRERPDINATIAQIYSAGDIVSFDPTFQNDRWFKLDSGLFISKNITVALKSDLTDYIKVETINDNDNLRVKPYKQDEYILKKLPKKTTFLVYKQKVANNWYVTKDHHFINANIVKIFK